ncbi:MAG TPA: GatB/YqeY domain-containing protein [Bryobacterales bacterium]|nr:GatB/YqeY domain-containing protein [Bryobacterales bacterium]
MEFQDQLQKDIQQAMRDRDEARLSALRMMKAAIKNKEVEAMKPLDEAGCFQVLATLIKQRRDSAEQFRKGNRPELADKEENEIKVIEGYMPAAPTEAEMDQAIADAIAATGITALKQMGVVMKAAQAKLAGKRVDGKALSDRVRARLR